MPSAGEADRGANGGGVETGQRELHRNQVEAGEGGRLSRASPRLQGKTVTSSSAKLILYRYRLKGFYLQVA